MDGRLGRSGVDEVSNLANNLVGEAGEGGALVVQGFQVLSKDSVE